MSGYRANCGACGLDIEADSYEQAALAVLTHMREAHGLEARPQMAVQVELGRDVAGHWIASFALPNGNTLVRVLDVDVSATQETALQVAAAVGQKIAQDPALMRRSPN